MATPARLIAPADLTLPGPGSRGVRQLLSAALLRSRALLAGLNAPDPQDPRAVLRRELPSLDQGFLLSALRRPSRFTLARCLEFQPQSPPALRLRWARTLAASLLLDAAEHGLLRAPVVFSLQEPLLSERSGWLLTLPPRARLSLSSRRIELHADGSSAYSELPAPPGALHQALTIAGASASLAQIPLWNDAVLLLQDTNPLAEQEAHPAKSGNRVDLGAHDPDRWCEALRGALAVIEEHLPEIAEEMKLLMGHIGPVGFFEQQHLSASYLEAMGVVYLSLHPHRMTLVEALVHEFQHNKLNLLLGLDATMENADWPLYASPVRPDPRPLRGVLLAVHAFQPIVHLYERLCEQPASGEGEVAWRRRRLGEVARLCREGCEVLLPNGRPTPQGAPLFEEITRLDRRFLPHVPAELERFSTAFRAHPTLVWEATLQTPADLAHHLLRPA
jgi:HEXXH motif-containing protein